MENITFVVPAGNEPKTISMPSMAWRIVFEYASNDPSLLKSDGSPNISGAIRNIIFDWDARRKKNGSKGA